MNYKIIRLIIACIAVQTQCTTPDLQYNCPQESAFQFIEQIQQPAQQFLLPDLFAFNQPLEQNSAPKKTCTSKKISVKQDAVWQKLSTIPLLLERDFLPGMQDAIQCIVARTHSDTQLTTVNDALDLDQQAQDHRAQLLDLINRFGQIYKCDSAQAHKLYTLITQQLAYLGSIKTQLLQIKSQA